MHPPPTHSDIVDTYLSLSPDIDMTSQQSSRSTPSLLSGSSVVPSPDSQPLAAFDPAQTDDPSILATLMATLSTMTPDQQLQFLQSTFAASFEPSPYTSSPPSDAESSFIQFTSNTNPDAYTEGALSNWLGMSLLGAPSDAQSSTHSSPMSAPINTADPLLSMLLTPNTQSAAAVPVLTQTSSADRLAALLSNASALPPPPPAVLPLPSTSTHPIHTVPDVATILSLLHGAGRQPPALQSIPNLLEIVQSALSKQQSATESQSSTPDSQRKEARQRKHDEMDADGSGSESGIAPSKNAKRRKAISAEEKEEKQRERMLRNRAAAQESRDKKKRYIETLESKTAELESENSTLQAKLRHSESQNRLLESRLEMLATHFIAQMTSKSSTLSSSVSALPLSPPSSTSSSQSPVFDVPHADSAAVDHAPTLSSHDLSKTSSLLRRLSNSLSRPPRASPSTGLSEDPTEVFAEPMLDADARGVGSTVSLSRPKHLPPHPPSTFAFGDADAFVIPSFADTRAALAVRNSGVVFGGLRKASVVPSPQRTLWGTSSWSPVLPTAARVSSPATQSNISRKVVVGSRKTEAAAVVVKEEREMEVGVPSASPSPPALSSSSNSHSRSWIGSDASATATGSRELAVVSAAVVHSVLLWVVDVTAGGVAGRWRGRPGAGSGARWGYTGAPGGGSGTPLLQKKRSWTVSGAGLRLGAGTSSSSSLSSSSTSLFSSNQERRALLVDGGKA